MCHGRSIVQYKCGENTLSSCVTDVDVQDPFNDDPYVRHKHCFRWVFALYFPQDTPIELGPTGILRGEGCYFLVSVQTIREIRDF
eukprot:SAG31_NODE_4406_length_3263_cov_1.473767_3_plen_85_part_00